MLGYSLGESRRCAFRELGRRRVDDDRDQVRSMRKRLIEGELSLPPWHVLGNQLRRVCVDREMTSDISDRENRDQQSGDDGEPWMERTHVDDMCNRRRQTRTAVPRNATAVKLMLHGSRATGSR